MFRVSFSFFSSIDKGSVRINGNAGRRDIYFLHGNKVDERSK